ncbi:hypothetical protein [Streptomyces bobili]|uniref:hypothetical protein n=1 Tax=Streptomyces bobili TaxID=67280 RepID=UPI003720A724
MTRAVSRALAASEDLISQADQTSGDEPAWIDFHHHARLSADAAEVFRDLKNPKASLAWNRRAAAMPSGAFIRSVGMRLAIVGTAHLQDRELDHGEERPAQPCRAPVRLRLVETSPGANAHRRRRRERGDWHTQGADARAVHACT